MDCELRDGSGDDRRAAGRYLRHAGQKHSRVLLMSERVAVEVLVRGRVQGVFFRGWTEEEARRRALTGWVSNNPDGTVSAFFTGPPDAVAEMIEACRRGPPAARVDGVETRPVDPPLPSAEDGRSFRILR